MLSTLPEKFVTPHFSQLPKQEVASSAFGKNRLDLAVKLSISFGPGTEGNKRMQSSRGIMFHDFHSAFHPRMPGSMSADDLSRMIGWLRRDHTILSPRDFLQKLKSGKGSPYDVVLTFDDTLRSQFDVARPVLEDENLTGIFHVNTATFDGDIPELQIYAHFRAQYFEDFNHFWGDFCKALDSYLPGIRKHWIQDIPDDWLADRPFYSAEQRVFRYFRDVKLDAGQYRAVMESLIAGRPDFSIKAALNAVFMSTNEISSLAAAGHSVGLHTHSHPTTLDRMPKPAQFDDFSRNLNWVVNITATNPKFAAYPCGVYSSDSIEVLQELGVEIAFRADTNRHPTKSLFEIPRENHVSVLGKMKI